MNMLRYYDTFLKIKKCTNLPDFVSHDFKPQLHTALQEIIIVAKPRLIALLWDNADRPPGMVVIMI